MTITRDLQRLLQNPAKQANIGLGPRTIESFGDVGLAELLEASFTVDQVQNAWNVLADLPYYRERWVEKTLEWLQATLSQVGDLVLA